MRDPDEGVTRDGTITTGVRRGPLLPPYAEAAAAVLSARHAALVREVGISAGDLATLSRDDRVGAAERAFLKHYCPCVAGPDLAAAYPPARASVDLAVGFNGDLADVLRTVRSHVAAAEDSGAPNAIAARAARKVLMSAATLLSAREGGWSTDRATAVDLVGRHAPHLRDLAVAALECADGPSASGPDVAIEPILDDLGGWLVAEYTAEGAPPPR